VTFPLSPRLARGGIVLMDPGTSRVLRVIAMQYNPDTLTRTIQAQGAGGEGGDRLEALRLKGPPNETLKVDVDIDATDQLEQPSTPEGDQATKLGIAPHLAVLETLVYPSSGAVAAADAEAGSGTLEIAPLEMPLTLFVWSRQRIVPVRITEFSVTEEAFDSVLNPIRAKVSLGMRVLTTTDLGLSHKGGAIYFAHHQLKERLAAMAAAGQLSNLGVQALP
jgi:hypothetical protein